VKLQHHFHLLLLLLLLLLEPQQHSALERQACRAGAKRQPNVVAGRLIGCAAFSPVTCVCSEKISWWGCLWRENRTCHTQTR
jgi:hypothetical protein